MMGRNCLTKVGPISIERATAKAQAAMLDQPGRFSPQTITIFSQSVGDARVYKPLIVARDAAEF
jgi:hypothetical protein